jgi:integrase
MARAKLTPAFVERKSKKPGLYADGGGLCLRVRSKTEAYWVYRYMLKGDARWMGLGSYPEISLVGARDKADAARKKKAEGVDPIDARKAAQGQSKTFRECATAYIEGRRDTWRNEKHAAQWSATLEMYAMPILGDMAVAEIEREQVLRVLDPIWKEKNETAGRVRGRIEAILDWAKARGFRSGENPAAWKGNLAHALPVRSSARQAAHHPALPYREMAAFVTALKGQGGISADALLFTILTAARTGEAIGARWSEIDLDAATWTVPADRTKTAREHRVPLSGPALKLLRTLHKATGGDGFVFQGMKLKRPLSNMAMLKTLERMGRDDLTVHGFRSSFRDWAEEQTAFGGSIAEAALGHVVGDKVEAAYRRGDLFEKRRKLMAAWATFGTTPAEGEKVIAIGRGSRG